MDTVFADRSIRISEFRKNPARVLRDAARRPVAVLSHDKPVFYAVEPALFEALLEQLADVELAPLVIERLAGSDRAIDVGLDEA